MPEHIIDTTKRGLFRMVLVAVLLAIGLLTLVVLPSEYGVDLTGFGRVTGLTKLSSQEGIVEHSDNISFANMESIDSDESGDEPFPAGVANKHPLAPAVQTFSITLQPLDEVEYKAVLTAGEPIFYHWSVVGNEEVYVDFHGDPTEGVFPEEYYQSYEEGEMTQSRGSFSATFTGNHGWYWLNIADHEITINLEVTGYYLSLEEIFRGNQRDKYR